MTQQWPENLKELYPLYETALLESDVDTLIYEHCGDVLDKIPAVMDRLAEGDQEAVSQGLTTCRRIIESFADSTYPPT